jgi:hypothetical protein
LHFPKILSRNFRVFIYFSNFGNISVEFSFLISSRASGDIMHNRRLRCAPPPVMHDAVLVGLKIKTLTKNELAIKKQKFH